MRRLKDIAADLDLIGFHLGSCGCEAEQTQLLQITRRLRDLAAFVDADPKAESTKRIQKWAPTARVLVPNKKVKRGTHG